MDATLGFILTNFCCVAIEGVTECRVCIIGDCLYVYVGFTICIDIVVSHHLLRKACQELNITCTVCSDGLKCNFFGLRTDGYKVDVVDIFVSIYGLTVIYAVYDVIVSLADDIHIFAAKGL